MQKKDKNLNTTLDAGFETNSKDDLEQNFNLALKMTNNTYDYSALINFLSSEKIVEKQMAALSLFEIKSIEDAMILVSNLTGQDGKIREAVAYKINELAKNSEFRNYFNSEKTFSILLQGIMDINGNVCRQIVDLILPWNDFKKYLSAKLPEQIISILLNIEKLTADEKQYVVSKRNFQLYWSLEALFDCVENVDIALLKEILLKTTDFEDYTIREKTAKILGKISDPSFDKLKKRLKNDSNYYVRRYF